jgi:hypothetical protein
VPGVLAVLPDVAASVEDELLADLDLPNPGRPVPVNGIHGVWS